MRRTPASSNPIAIDVPNAQITATSDDDILLARIRSEREERAHDIHRVEVVLEEVEAAGTEVDGEEAVRGGCGGGSEGEGYGFGYFDEDAVKWTSFLATALGEVFSFYFRTYLEDKRLKRDIAKLPHMKSAREALDSDLGAYAVIDGTIASHKELSLDNIQYENAQ